MRTGRLRHRVTVKGFETVPDGAGGTTSTETIITETWADVQPISAKRGVENGRIIEGQYYSITMRYNEGLDLDKSESIEYEGRRVVVHSVINKDERNKVIEILAFEQQ